MLTKKRAFSLMEIVVALGIFSIMMGAGLNGFAPVLKQNRRSIEITRANRLAEEGLEAARSIRNRNFSVLASGTFGIGISSNLWAFSGTSDVTDKYKRQIFLTRAQRDEGGTLVSSGGTTDPNTYLVKSLISWNYSVGQTKTFSLDTILTNWRKAITTVDDGMMLYGNGTVTTPRSKSYVDATNNFKTQIDLPTGGNARTMVARTSPVESESVLGLMDNTGNLYVYCFNGFSWSLDWSVGTGITATSRPFDIRYESNSGDVMVVYGTGVATTNEIAYRVKLGASGCGAASWSNAVNFNPARTSGKINWVKMVRDSRSTSNLIAMAWVDFNKDLSAAIWNGSTFTNEPTAALDTSLEAINTGTTFPDVDAFDLEYETTSGDLMVVWGNSGGANGTNGTRYKPCTGGIAACTWGTGGTIPQLLDDATNLDLSPNPTNDQLIFASIGNAGADLQAAIWSGTGWTGFPNLDTSSQAPLAGTHLVDTAWVVSAGTSRGVIVYNDSNATNVGWYVSTTGTNIAAQSDWAPSKTFSSPQKWYELQSDPVNMDKLMFSLSDNNRRLFSKRLVMASNGTFTWSNSDGGTGLGVTLPQNTVSPFTFIYWKQ